MPRRIREYDAQGNAASAHQVEEAGFVVGMEIISKKNMQHGAIVTMKAQEVVVKLDGGQKELRLPPTEFLAGQWKEVKPLADVEKLEGMECYMPKMVPMIMKQMKVEAEVTLALLEACAEDCSQFLQIQSKPRGCVAMKKFGKGKLVLVPATPNVKVVAGKPDVPKNHVVCNVKGISKEWSVFLVPSPCIPKEGDDKSILLAAYWWCKPTDKQEDANMKVDVVASSGIPVMKNSKEVQKGDLLVVYRPAASEATASGGQPKKKARRS